MEELRKRSYTKEDEDPERALRSRTRASLSRSSAVEQERTPATGFRIRQAASKETARDESEAVNDADVLLQPGREDREEAVVAELAISGQLLAWVSRKGFKEDRKGREVNDEDSMDEEDDAATQHCEENTLPVLGEEPLEYMPVCQPQVCKAHCEDKRTCLVNRLKNQESLEHQARCSNLFLQKASRLGRREVQQGVADPLVAHLRHRLQGSANGVRQWLESAGITPDQHGISDGSDLKATEADVAPLGMGERANGKRKAVGFPLEAKHPVAKNRARTESKETVYSL